MNKRYVIFRAVLSFFTIFVGIGAFAGAICMFIDPSGKILQMDGLLPYFEVLPFSDVLFNDYVFPGIALIIVNGISNLTAAVLLLKGKKSGIICGMIFGVTLMLWITIQFVIFPTNALSIIFFITGALQLLSGYICFVGYSQWQFALRRETTDIPNVKDAKKLVVYFSRTGYTEQIARNIALREGADLLKIVATERTEGDLGFWWCGRFAMHKWGMPIKNYNTLPSNYDEITLCTPVWVFDISAPMRKFCEDNAGKIKKVNYVFTHFMNAKFYNLADKTDEILGIKHSGVTSYRVRFGNAKELK